jgi:hypothetical protein
VEQSALTIVARVKAGAVQDLRSLLATMQPDPAGNAVIPFGRLSGVHYARMVVLDGEDGPDGNIPPHLLYLSDVDGPTGRHLEELVDVAGSGIDAVFGFCEGYPAAATRESRLKYLRAGMVRAAAIYVNTIGRTVTQIRDEARLREAIEAFLDREPERWSGAGPREVRAAIQAFVQSEQGLRWAQRPAGSPTLVERVWLRLGGAATILLLILLSPLTILAFPFWLVALRLHERRDKAEVERASVERVQQLAAVEDLVATNQFSAVGHVKPGSFRRITASIVLWLIGFGIRQVYHHNNLSGVKTIHFARWVFVDGKRRLFFASNYDGSLESYMGDFIDKVAWGLNAVFSNGVNYPRTNWLIFKGAKDEQAFKYYIRSHQVPTDVWYAAYDELTAVNVENNAQIRERLHGDLDVAATREWLRRF